jgi:hypothetical protein
LRSIIKELDMPPVADDFAAIAKRLKEIQQEVAAETAAAQSSRQPDAERQPKPSEVHDDIAACG